MDKQRISAINMTQYISSFFSSTMTNSGPRQPSQYSDSLRDGQSGD